MRRYCSRSASPASPGRRLWSPSRVTPTPWVTAATKPDPHLNVSFKVSNLFGRKDLTSQCWSQSYYAPSHSATLSLSWKH